MSKINDLEERRDKLIEDIRDEQWRQDNRLANRIRIEQSKRYVKNMKRELAEVKAELERERVSGPEGANEVSSSSEQSEENGAQRTP